MNKSSRLLSIGASEINTLMNGSEKEIHELWLIKTKQKKEPDLTNPKECDNWFQVILGTLTESLNLTAFEYNFPDLDVRLNTEAYAYKNKSFITATPDALIYDKDENLIAVIDAKHTHPFNGNYNNKEERVATTYYWQMQQQMLCLGVDKYYISPIYGNSHGDVIEGRASSSDQLKLIGRAEWFWDHVENMKEPPVTEPIKAIVPSEYRSIKLSETNFASEISEHVNVWLDNKDSVNKFKEADKEIKQLIPDDVNHASDYGIVITRSKPSKTRTNGSLTIKEKRE